MLTIVLFIGIKLEREQERGVRDSAKIASSVGNVMLLLVQRNDVNVCSVRPDKTRHNNRENDTAFTEAKRARPDFFDGF